MRAKDTARAIFLITWFLAVPLPGQSRAAAAAPQKLADPGEVSSVEVPRRHPRTLLDFALAGGWMMVPLCVCSVVMVGFFLERLIVLRRGRVAPRRLLTALAEVVRERPLDRDRALAVAAAHPSPAAAILRVVIERLESTPEKLEKGAKNAADREAYRLRDRLWIFAILSTVSPLLGLLGTVTGLVQAFREVAISGLGAGATLAPGIYEALVCTVAGLAIAIPSIAMYYWLHARVDRYMHEIDGLAVDIVDAGELSPAR